MHAFVIINFCKNPKYLEYEIYFLLNLKKNTKNDILYLYSINDTPPKYIEIIKKYCTKVIPYDDNGITYNIEQNYQSVYQHFNTLRTCNFMFAYKLIEYKKICLLESDMIILKNIDDIFDLKAPSVYFYKNKNIFENTLVENNNNFLYECKNSSINGGTMLIKPSLSKYKLLLKNIKNIIQNNCTFPNESLFIISNKNFYHMPFKYNGQKYILEKIQKNYEVD